jgi:hypothetical protein
MRLSLVEAQLEGTYFLSSKHADIEVCHSYTFVDYILIEILFSCPINVLQIF